MKRPIAIVLLAVLAAASAVAQSREARTIKYAAKDIVLIKAKLRYTTLIVLPQNEKILDFVTGDKDFWIVEGNAEFLLHQTRQARQHHRCHADYCGGERVLILVKRGRRNG